MVAGSSLGPKAFVVTAAQPARPNHTFGNLALTWPGLSPETFQAGQDKYRLQ
jgi:hypothetical protein